MKKVLVFLFVLCIIPTLTMAKKIDKKKNTYGNKPHMVDTRPIIDPKVLLEHQKLYRNPAVEIITHEVYELPYLPNFPLDRPYKPKYQWGTKTKSLQETLR